MLPQVEGSWYRDSAVTLTITSMNDSSIHSDIPVFSWFDLQRSFPLVVAHAWRAPERKRTSLYSPSRTISQSARIVQVSVFGKSSDSSKGLASFLFLLFHFRSNFPSLGSCRSQAVLLFTLIFDNVPWWLLIFLYCIGSPIGIWPPIHDPKAHC